jgi:hypothetical protein
LLPPPQDAFRADRLQLIFSAFRLEKMDLQLVLNRLGAFLLQLQQKYKTKISFLKKRVGSALSSIQEKLIR